MSQDQIGQLAYSILNSLNKQQVENLTEILTYFNNHCEEASRANCLKNGCQDKGLPKNAQIVESFQKKANASYYELTTTRCACCGK